ncbi:hypothetical protein HAX54_042544, partial [Datura stramonium]|nr:hypothetical protein [Datura stramonium]
MENVDAPLEIPCEEEVDQGTEIANAKTSSPILEGVTTMDDTSWETIIAKPSPPKRPRIRGALRRQVERK